MDRLFQKCVERAELKKKVTPHTLRHSAAVHYLLGGAPISFVQDLLGHENLSMTGIYTQLADEMTKKIALETETALEGIAKKDRGRAKEKGPRCEVQKDRWDRFVRQALGRKNAKRWQAP